MKPIKEIQEALNNLKGYYYYDADIDRYSPYGKNKTYKDNVNTIQELIDNYTKLEQEHKELKEKLK